MKKKSKIVKYMNQIMKIAICAKKIIFSLMKIGDIAMIFLMIKINIILKIRVQYIIHASMEFQIVKNA